MRVECYLRGIRGDRSLSEISELCGVNRGHLSMLERGRWFPPDRDLPAIESAYGATAAEWYSPRLLLELQHDPAGEPA